MSGHFQIEACTPSKNIYFYIFHDPIPASSLKKRVPSLFPISETNVRTDSILPPTGKRHVNLKFIINTEGTENEVMEGRRRFNILGETAKNRLLRDSVAKCLQTKGWIVHENKSVMGSDRLVALTVCSTTQPDLIVFHPTKHIMVLINDKFVVEVSTLVTENKDDEDTCSQQLLGNAEKALGETILKFAKSNSHHPEVTYIKVYAMSLHHKADKCIVRRILVDFLNNQTSLERGEEFLTKEEASNRVIEQLMS